MLCGVISIQEFTCRLGGGYRIQRAERSGGYRFLTSGFNDALEDNDNLKLFVHEGALGQVEEGALGIDFVADGERGHQEELVCTRPETNVQLALVQRQELALGCLTRLKDSQEKERGRNGQRGKDGK